jgi:hypothetical protein
MKPYFLIASCFLILNSCSKKKYEWENYTYTAVPEVSVNTAKSALPTIPSAKTSFFNIKSPNLASQEFEFTLNWNGFGMVTVNSIDVYLSYNKKETSAPAYPIVVSTPGNEYPNIYQFPLPSLVKSTDKLLETVSAFPKKYTFTASQLATLTNADLTKVEVNDYFLFKFILNLSDGRKIVSFFNNICDESRGEPGDCRVGARFKSQ